MNIYRGCLHDCVYCDGRAEKYRVEGEFGKNNKWGRADSSYYDSIYRTFNRVAKAYQMPRCDP